MALVEVAKPPVVDECDHLRLSDEVKLFELNGDGETRRAPRGDCSGDRKGGKGRADGEKEDRTSIFGEAALNEPTRGNVKMKLGIIGL